MHTSRVITDKADDLEVGTSYASREAVRDIRIAKAGTQSGIAPCSIKPNTKRTKLYDRAQWKRLRVAQLQAEPFCVFCAKQGRTIPATVVDHITPHRGSEVLFFDAKNLQSLCKSCHDGVKQRIEKSGVISGCDAKGFPLDPKHHWNAE